MMRHYWAVLGTSKLSVIEASQLIAQALGQETENFIQEYTNTIGVKKRLSSDKPFFSVCRNSAHESLKGRNKYPTWYEEKFKQYSVLAFVSADNGPDIEPVSSWDNISLILNNFCRLNCLYIKETLR